MTTITTYDNNDCAHTGWDIRTGRIRTVATYRSRWQGSRDGIRLAIYDGGALVAGAQVETEDGDSLESAMHRELDMILEYVRDACALRRGGVIRYRGWLVRVTDPGYQVQ